MLIAIHPPFDVEYTPKTALAELLVQHAELRRMMDHCEELAEALDEDRVGPMALTQATAKLRVAFTAHNEFEERILRPVLLQARVGLEVDRMVAEHVGEHRAMRSRLGMSTQTYVLREVIESLREHLDSEEQALAARHVPK